MLSVSYPGSWLNATWLMDSEFPEMVWLGGKMTGTLFVLACLAAGYLLLWLTAK